MKGTPADQLRGAFLAGARWRDVRGPGPSVEAKVEADRYAALATKPAEQPAYEYVGYVGVGDRLMYGPAPANNECLVYRRIESGVGAVQPPAPEPPDDVILAIARLYGVISGNVLDFARDLLATPPAREQRGAALTASARESVLIAAKEYEQGQPNSSAKLDSAIRAALALSSEPAPPPA